MSLGARGQVLPQSSSLIIIPSVNVNSASLARAVFIVGTMVYVDFSYLGKGEYS